MDHTSLREREVKKKKKNSVQGFYAVCGVQVMAEWVRDRFDCLWDGGGTRDNQ